MNVHAITSNLKNVFKLFVYQADTCINKSVIEKYKNTIETLDSPFSVEKISITVKNRLMPVIVGKLILKLFQEFLNKQFKTYLL